MTTLTLLLLLAVIFGLARLFRRLGDLRQRIATLEARLAELERGDAPAPPVVAPRRPVAPPRRRSRRPRLRSSSPPRPRPTFEQLVGGKLPIWIGGTALALAGFFLVRYSIELGLLGPVSRTVIAALFGLALIAASEAARRYHLTRDDPRIAQALAGAGVASLYGTLYVGAALYHLIGVGAAFALLILVTLGALALALRHGPPTAIMALIGGFVAPLIAGIDATGVGALLVYLALLVSALFGLAIRRGWAWLALAASGGGFVWINVLIAFVSADKLPGVGAFVLLLAIGATLALPATAPTRRWLRLAPLIVGLIQLMILAPALDFSPFAWGFYLVLSAAALALATHDETLAPGAAGALLLIVLLLAVALDRGVPDAPLAALATTLLFGAIGHWRARRSPIWASIALGATAAPLLLIETEQHAVLPPTGWALLLALAAIAAGSLSWRAPDEANSRPTVGLVGGTVIAALLAGALATEMLPIPWRWPAWLATGVGLAAWARRTGDRTLARLPLAPVAITALAMATTADRLAPYLASTFADGITPPVADLVAIGLLPAALVAVIAWLTPDRRTHLGLTAFALLLGLGLVTAILPAPWHAAGLALVATVAIAVDFPLAGLALFATAAAMLPTAIALLRLAALSLAGDRLPYLHLPPLANVLRDLALPAGLSAAMLLYRPMTLARYRRIVWPMIAAAIVASVYALAKTPLAIATPAAFVASGFTERAIITQLFFVTAWFTRDRQPPIARTLFWIALGRVVWFDLLLLDPLWVRQSVGAWPLANAATIGAGLTAFWLWRHRAEPRWHRASLAATLVALLVTIRQLTHGAILTGPLGRTENWLYSAAGLGLALIWLWRGITTGVADLRLAGLALLTLVTLKVFLIDAAALEGVLRILSFLGLGIALIGIGWAYGRMTRTATLPEPAP